ncbi:IclR family transcriptional regulator [Parafrigoribacterium mesophilum]|uniref:IclR family transcriptional regulator n=1 Tax=Parafrigoribacterium mesophilum TaxID=433646 RepID=UPI0031FC564C
MQNAPQKRKPTYSLESVDNALHLIQVLRDEGRLRLKDAAQQLGIAPSTAHRLMAMLVYRGFAVQDESRTYLPGPSVGVPPVFVGWTKQLRRLAQPHLELLLGRLGETVNLMIRVGTSVRFLQTIESSRFLRVGDRQGSVLPARHASGGKAMLAELDTTHLARLYQAQGSAFSADRMSAREFDSLVAELRRVRDDGYAVNTEETEEGLVAVGAVLTNRSGVAVGAFSVAAPAIRSSDLLKEDSIGLILATRAGIERDIAGLSLDDA